MPAEDAGGRPPPQLLRAALRAAGPRALSVVARRVDDFTVAEDAVQTALLEASARWSRDGIPDSPTAWLVTAAGRRAIDTIRSDAARRERERRFAALAVTEAEVPAGDDTLALHLLCCHPALARTQRVTLTLRCVGGLGNREIARGLMVAESTIAQRVSRAKAALRAAGARFALPDSSEIPDRIAAVMDVLAVVHTEGHTATEGEEVGRPLLAAEARRLARELLDRTGPDASWRSELQGLLALMLLTDARAAARTDDQGRLVALADQDRRRWNPDWIGEAETLLAEAIPRGTLGRYQLRAAIAGVHAASGSPEDTDWLEILGLYDLLCVIDPGPIAALGRVVALGEVAGPSTALAELDTLVGRAPAGRVAAVRAHLLTRAGFDARAAYRDAAALATNGAERVWFEDRASLPPER